MKPSPTYKSYLLRLWRVTHNGELVWRASLQSPISGQQQGFTSLESLFAYLAASAHEPSETADADADLAGPDRTTDPPAPP